MIQKKAWLPRILPAMILLILCLAGCGNQEEAGLTTAAAVDQNSLVQAYIEAYENVDYRKMWGCWPQETFGGKASILADMKKDIFRNYYSAKARLSIEQGELIPCEKEDKEKIISYFSIADIDYVTDAYKMDYKAVVDGGKRDGDIYKKGTIFVFRNHGKWYVYDD